MGKICLIFSDQLSHSLSSLKKREKGDTVLMGEVMEEATYVQHHPKKIAFLWATMGHFSEELKERDIPVRYMSIKDPSHTGTLTGEVGRAIKDLNAKSIIVTEPSEYRLKCMVESWQKLFGIPVDIYQDDRFLCSIEEFKAWSHTKKQLRMEYFYREMRKKYKILIESQDLPVGGQWNYDKKNRKPPRKGLSSPQRLSHKKSAILKEVLALVSEKFSHHFGDLLPFHYAVTRQQALLELEDFIVNILPDFGEYQDAMVKDEPYLNHSLLSSYINAGLLLPLEVCQKAETAYRQGKAPLHGVEGFIRQILGWREYVRGIYWLKMPNYSQLNYLEAQTPLPAFYWGSKTHMTCIAEAVIHTQKYAYSHHIQRLMVTGNFALIAGLDVHQVQEWYLSVYSDAYEWVEMPNTLGMALFGDGGIVGSKPYAASAHYIHKMSNFCQYCSYNPQEMLGEKACPFNGLYWDFLARNHEKLKDNPRLSMAYRIWHKFGHEKQEAIKRKAFQTMERMKEGIL